MRISRNLGIPILFLLAAVGCERGPDPRTVTVQAALTNATHDVGGFLFEVSCDNGFTLTQYIPLEDESLPEWLDPGAGPGHPFSDLFATMPPGHCTVTATPMQDADTPSEECHPVTAEFDVTPEHTTEIVLMAQCDGDPTGAGDIVVGLNDPPALALVLSPSKFVCVGETVTMTATAVDPNGDALTYGWSVTDWPEAPGAGTYVLTQSGPDATFVAATPGPYTLTVTVTDPYGASATLEFPLHVSDGPECRVCCKLDALVWVPTADCPEGAVVPDALCEEVCCKLDDGFATVPPADCPPDRIAPEDLCVEVCCKLDGGFQTVPSGECPPGRVVPDLYCDEQCGCPEGFLPTPDGSECVRTSTVPATPTGTLHEVCHGERLTTYGLYGARYPGGLTVTDPFFGPPGNIDDGDPTDDGRLNTIGVWACDGNPDDFQSPPYHEWLGFTACIDAPAAGDYLVGLAADNELRFFIDDAPSPAFELHGMNTDNFRYWWIHRITLSAGPHVLRLEGLNLQQIAAFGADVSGPFPAGSLATDAAMAAADYAGKILFSTAQMLGGTFQTGESSGWTCPDGFVLAACGDEPHCTQIERVPCL